MRIWLTPLTKCFLRITIHSSCGTALDRPYCKDIGGDMAMKTSTMTSGRIAVYVPNHPRANNRGYILRSRYRMERKLGRLLRSDEHVHHKNEDKTDDRLSNLQIKSRVEHAQHHFQLGKSKFGKPVLSYVVISAYIYLGFGYKRIARITGYRLYSVKSACRIITRGYK